MDKKTLGQYLIGQRFSDKIGGDYEVKNIYGNGLGQAIVRIQLLEQERERTVNLAHLLDNVIIE